MLIVCPNCKKQFDVDPALLRDVKKLRCSSCKAVFGLVRKAPERPATAAPAASAAPQGAATAAPAAPAATAATAATASAPAPAAPQPAAAPVAAPAAAAAAPAAPSAPAAAPGAVPAATPAGSGRLQVVIANESVSFCEAVRKVLASEPFELFICNDGKEALETVQRIAPQVLLLDVALPTMFGFEVCEKVRQDPALSGVKIVLIASIYDKTRYKRSPNSLYGADDYIEKHHIPDSLVPMIYRLASGSTPVIFPGPRELAVQQETRSELREVEVRETVAAPPAAELPAQAATPDPAAASPVAGPAPATAAPQPRAPEPAQLSEAELKARRLARIIVSDIVLYNQAKVEQGLREGNFYTLLADDIREGENLYQQRVALELRERTSFLKEAFEDLIAKKRAEMRI